MRCRSGAVALLVAVFCFSLPLSASAQSVKPEDEPKLIATLQSGDITAKARACQQLAAAGTKAAVPALASLLADEHLAAYARSALEAIADPSAGDALRKALSTVRGRQLVGVVNSLGVRGDAKSAGALARLAGGPDAELAAASLAALSRIEAPESAKAIGRALGSGTDEVRSAAAYASLVVGDRRLKQGKRDEALKLYAVVERSQAAKHLRLAATQRTIVTQGAAGIPLLFEQLASADKAVVAVGLRAIRQMPGVEVTRALVARLPKAKPATQALLVQALLDRGDEAALPGIESVASTGAPEARLAAIAALGEVGQASSVAVLLKCATSAAVEAEVAAACASLTRLPFKEVDGAVLGALPTAKPAVQTRLSGILAARQSPGAADVLMKLAAGADPEVRKASLRALVGLSRPGDLPELVRIAAQATDEGVREAAGRAALAAAWKSPDIGGRSAPFAAAIRDAKGAATKGALLGLLAEIGTYPAYGVVKEAANDPDAHVRAAAVQALADWPDATPASVLLGVAQSAAEAPVRSAALRGAIRMAGGLAAECARPSDQITDWLRQANGLIKADAGEKRLILSALGALKSVDGLLLIQPYLADPAVRGEAGLAALQAAKGVPDEQKAMAKSVVEQIAASGDEGVRAQAAELAKQIAGASAPLRAIERAAGEIDPEKLTFRVLFDGRTFEGWEGDTLNAFRIEDGAITGGSMKAGLKQNEFLATTRCYANFVLRLECKLTGPANGGIQIRSQRVPKSAEVCGYQPDMDSSGQYWGCLYDESRRGMLVQADVAKTKPVVKLDDWNAYEIRCEGPRIRLYVNGLLTVDYTEKDPDIPLCGILAVQVHQGQPSETRYRNIRIAELP